jgi:signal transduction histidine kinase
VQFQIKRGNFNVREAFNDIINMYTMQAKSKDINILCEFSNNVPTEVTSDKKRLQQILSNLLNNALKFSDCFMNIKIIVNYFIYSQYLLFTVIENRIGIAK